MSVPKQLNDYFKRILDQLDDANIPVEQRILALINLTAVPTSNNTNITLL
jgi:hypothetical protein